MSSTLSREEKQRLSNERQAAVRNAWKAECQRVQEGKGSRNWSVQEQKEMLERGSVKGYEGHHMKSVSEYPEYAGDPNNIQFLTEDEHLQGAHQGNYHNATNGYYDPEKGSFLYFDGDSINSIPTVELSERYTQNHSESLDSIRKDYDQEQSKLSSNSNNYDIILSRSEYEQEEYNQAEEMNQSVILNYEQDTSTGIAFSSESSIEQGESVDS